MNKYKDLTNFHQNCIYLCKCDYKINQLEHCACDDKENLKCHKKRFLIQIIEEAFEIYDKGKVDWNYTMEHITKMIEICFKESEWEKKYGK